MSDNRRDQLIKFVEREFIGPDPIDWPGMTQSNGQEILASDPPRTRYIAGILYPAETTDDKADLKDDECELLGESDGEDVEVKPQKLGDGIVEFLEDAEELINRSNAYRQYILQCWEDWNPRKWEPAKNPDWSYADPVPLMYSAGSHPNEAWGSRGIETPTSMRSVDASCEAEVLTNRYVPKEG